MTFRCESQIAEFQAIGGRSLRHQTQHRSGGGNRYGFCIAQDFATGARAVRLGYVPFGLKPAVTANSDPCRHLRRLRLPLPAKRTWSARPASSGPQL